MYKASRPGQDRQDGEKGQESSESGGQDKTLNRFAGSDTSQTSAQARFKQQQQIELVFALFEVELSA
jgi:hypothetical protein